MKLSLYRSVVKTKQDLLLLVGTGCLVFVWFFSYYSHNQDIIVRTIFEIKNLENQQRPMIKTKVLQENLEQTIKSLKIKLRHPFQTLPTTTTRQKQSSRYMTDFANKACKAGLRLDSCVVKKHTDKTWFAQHTVSYEMTGSEEQIDAFIKAVRTSDQTVRCSALNIKKADSQTSHLGCTLRFLTFKEKETPPCTPTQKTATHNKVAALPKP